MNIPQIYDNSTLSVSSKKITHCQEVAEYFRQCKIQCHVTTNHTVVCTDTKNDTYDMEIGCQIKFGKHSPSLIDALFWLQLKDRFDLNCAHLDVEGKFKGCIYNFLRKGMCPGEYKE